jgi:hypothetical protein
MTIRNIVFDDNVVEKCLTNSIEVLRNERGIFRNNELW